MLLPQDLWTYCLHSLKFLPWRAYLFPLGHISLYWNVTLSETPSLTNFSKVELLPLPSLFLPFLFYCISLISINRYYLLICLLSTSLIRVSNPWEQALWVFIHRLICSAYNIAGSQWLINQSITPYYFLCVSVQESCLKIKKGQWEREPDGNQKPSLGKIDFFFFKALLLKCGITWELRLLEMQIWGLISNLKNRLFS